MNDTPPAEPAAVWDADMAEQVQPVISAIFHDLMGPLTLLKNRLFLVRKQLRQLMDAPGLDPAHRARALSILALLDGLEEAGHRIHRGLAVPRDAIWESVLTGRSFDPSGVIDEIAAVTTIKAGTAGAAPLTGHDLDVVEVGRPPDEDVDPERPRRPHHL